MLNGAALETKDLTNDFGVPYSEIADVANSRDETSLTRWTEPPPGMSLKKKRVRILNPRPGKSNYTSMRNAIRRCRLGHAKFNERGQLVFLDSTVDQLIAAENAFQSGMLTTEQQRERQLAIICGYVASRMPMAKDKEIAGIPVVQPGVLLNRGKRSAGPPPKN